MKSKHHRRQIPLVLLGIPLLFLSPVTQAEEEDQDEKAAETAETAKEKEETRPAKEAAKRTKEAAKIKELAADPIQEDEKAPAPEEVPDSPAQAPAGTPEDASKPEAAEPPERPTEGQVRKETAPGSRERTERRPSPNEPREGRERREPPAPPADPAPPAPPANPPADKAKRPVDMPVVPTEPLEPREAVEPQANDPESGKNTTPELAPDRPAEPEIAEIPASEPERLAESEVMEVTREVQREFDQRKTRIEGRQEAQALIDEILGAESRISRAEMAREERFRPRLERQRQRPGEERLRQESPEQRRAATTYFQERLRGREVEGPPPEFFRRSELRGDRRGLRNEDRVVERVEYVRPRYLNKGRRYVHFDSRAAIPAILMAAQAMNQVRFQPAPEIAPIFYGHQEDSATHAMPLPPENYRSEDSWVVSYPVDENSMISSEDILFLQGSTQFSDPYSYEVIGIMADAMKTMPEEERFVIEGHASAEGSYDSNMILSQQRAEHIVREIVRRGVSPYRLLPVGYGESEARHPADAAEALRGQDRRVVVFRMKPESVAQR